MKKVYNYLFISVAFLLGINGIQAQVFPLSISVTVNPPYTANYASYFNNPNQIFIRITNTSTITYSVFLAGSISTLDNSIYIRKSIENRWSAPALDIPPGIHTYSSADLKPFSQSNDVEYGGVTNEDLLAGNLPEGEYQICLQAIGYETLTQLSPGEPSGCSNVFGIRHPSPPQIIAPLCGSDLILTTPQNIIFSWLPSFPEGMLTGTQIHYRFKLVLLADNIDAVSALEYSVDPVYSADVTTNTLNYSVVQPKLLFNRSYAWMVQAYDPQHKITFQNDGNSEPCVFQTLNPAQTNSPFSNVFPISGDTLPWSYFPFIHRFDPYSDDYTRYDKTFEIYENGQKADSYTYFNNWPWGPRISQSSVLKMPLTSFQAQHLNLYKPQNANHIDFKLGNKYEWNAEVSIHGNSNELSANLYGNFVHGMGRPRPSFPSDKETVLIDKELELKFITSSPPQLLVPPFIVTQTGKAEDNNLKANFFDGGIDERWLLELSRKNDFSIILASGNERLGYGLSYLSGEDQGQNLINKLYKEANFKFTPKDTGEYFWRVRWLSNPNQITGASYLDGPVRSFMVANELKKTDEPPKECVNTCDGPIIPANEKVPVSSIAIGETVKIGLFEMHITDITWNASLATGKGTILVPMMRAPMKVTFSNISINANKRVFSGAAVGEYDNRQLVPDNVALELTKISSIDNEQALLLNAFINHNERLVSQLLMDIPMGLPIGFDQNIEGKRVTIGIVGLRFTPETATLNAMVSLEFPDFHGWLSLGATNVCFHPDGLGGDGKGMLYLPQDHDIPFGNNTTLRFDKTTFNEDNTTVKDSGTYVSWDCRGFKSLNIDGSVIFGRNLLVEDLDNGEPGPTQVVAEFSARVRRHQQWLARLNFTKPFQVTGIPGWGFDVEEAWLDFSDGENPDGFEFPKGYVFETTEFTGDVALSSIPNPNLYWKGFYLKRQFVRLPKEFKTYSNPDGRLTASVNNMLIDRTGLTASFKVENIVSIATGNLAEWRFSIDTLSVSILKNTLTNGGFQGKLILPVSDSALVYSALIKQDITKKELSYELNVHPKGKINANLWQAELTLEPSSFIHMDYVGSAFTAQAELNGKMTINAENDVAAKVNFKGISFEGLGIKSSEPYLYLHHFSFASPQKFLGGVTSSEANDTSKAGGFPVSVKNIGFAYVSGGAGNPPSAGIKFTLDLNLTGESNTFKASTEIALLGKLDMLKANGKMWEFDRVNFNSVDISGSVGVVDLAGGVKFYQNDPVYGNGMKGYIDAAFKPTIQVKVAAQFGEKEGRRYWFADAQASFSPSIPICTGLNIYGFGGGAYYHMRRTTALPSATLTLTTTADSTGKGGPGVTLTGVNYVPDFNTAFGFSATAVIGCSGSEDAFNADVTFGAELSQAGGINLMYLRGNAFFVCTMSDRSKTQIRGTADISYDFRTSVFDGRFEIFVNIAGGLITGIGGANNPAGSAQIYASPQTWFAHIGTPQNPLGISFNKMFNAQTYFMMGKQLPPPLSPPAEVYSVITPGVLYRNPAIESGDGFAFGSSMRLEPQKLQCSIFKAELAMGLGFDISLMNYGSNVFCESAAPGSTIGISGWYANGQIYAYVMGYIGISADIFGDGKPLEIPIIDISAAALLQGGLPNPTWFQGTVGGYYNVFGGAIKGNCNFEFKYGEECRPAPESPMAKLDIIGDLVPQNGEKNVDCGIVPEAAFNMEIQKEFNLEETSADGSSKKNRRFRYVLERFELRKGNNLVQTTIEQASNNLEISLNPSSYLDPFTDYKIIVRVKGEEYNFQSGTWSQALKRDGSVIQEEKQNVFTTGAYPDRIPDDNVSVTYPLNTQRFVLQDECRYGFIQLKKWMGTLFSVPQSTTTQRLFKVKFVPIDGGQEQETTLELDEGSRRLNFILPNLNNSKIYACQIIARDSSLIPVKPGIKLMSIGTDAFSSLHESYFTQEGGAQVRNNRIDGRSINSDEKLLYVLFFKTSQFNRLQEKFASITASSTEKVTVGLAESLIPSFTGPEAFDVFDINGYNKEQAASGNGILPLLRMAEARTDLWNTNWANPTIYDFYSLLVNGSNYTSMRLYRSSPDNIGIPPWGTVGIDQSNQTVAALSPSEFLPLSSSASSVFTNLNVTHINSSITNAFEAQYAQTPSALTLNVQTGVQTWIDYQTMTTIVNQLFVQYGGLPEGIYGNEFFPMELVNPTRNFLNSNFQSMYPTTYGVRFYYNPPNGACVQFEPGPPEILKNYVLAPTNNSLIRKELKGKGKN